MKDFVLAALPLVLCGIAVAVICANLRRKKTKEKTLEQSMAIGISLGLMLSPALNSIGLWENHGLGFALRPLWGMALAVLFHKNTNADENRSE